jgi:hypothetical protein
VQKIDQMYAVFTGQPLEKVQQYTERDRFLSTSEVCGSTSFPFSFWCEVVVPRHYCLVKTCFNTCPCVHVVMHLCVHPHSFGEKKTGEETDCCSKNRMYEITSNFTYSFMFLSCLCHSYNCSLCICLDSVKIHAHNRTPDNSQKAMILYTCHLLAVYDLLQAIYSS